jgi:AcrR family transcriptional regulator
VTANSTERPLPGQEPLPREFISRHQQARIVAALARETAEKGYRAVTVADIVKRAKVSRKTFYENFASKEKCFLAAQEEAMATALERVVTASGTFKDWPQQVRAGLTAFLDYVAEEPTLARTCLVEALSAGPAAVKYHEESQQAFVSLFRLGRNVSPETAELPDALEEATVGGVFWIVYQRLASGAEGEITSMLSELIEFTLVPYLGVETAREIAAASDVGGAWTASSS